VAVDKTSDVAVDVHCVVVKRQFPADESIDVVAEEDRQSNSVIDDMESDPDSADRRYVAGLISVLALDGGGHMDPRAWGHLGNGFDVQSSLVVLALEDQVSAPQNYSYSRHQGSR